MVEHNMGTAWAQHGRNMGTTYADAAEECRNIGNIRQKQWQEQKQQQEKQKQEQVQEARTLSHATHARHARFSRAAAF